MIVFATVGTDAHPFDRLVHWLDEIAGSRPDLTIVVQHGASVPPQVAKGIDYVDHAGLIELLQGADVVITHGGPATIMEAREHHGRPIAVPRDPDRGEHVDGHQLAFCAMLANNQRVSLARTRAEIEACIETHLGGLAHAGLDAPVLPVGVDRFMEEVDKVMATPRRRRGLWARFQARQGAGQ